MIAALTGVLLATSAVAGTPQFTDASASSGLQSFTTAPGMGSGLVAADFDDDGDIDVFVPTAEGTPHQLYENLTADGATPLFREIAHDVGLNSHRRGRSAVWFDANGDQRLDLLVASDCFQTDCVAGESMLHLYQQQPDHTFVDVTVASGLFDDAAEHSMFWHRGGVTAGDLDGDGDNDLYTTTWKGGARMYLNDGSGHFADVSDTSGTGLIASFAFGAWQSIIHDFNADLQADLFVAVDYAEDLLFIQDEGLFADVAPSAGLDRSWNGMGVSLGDVDNDGDFDLYVTNISGEWPDGEIRYSTFYRNDSTADEQIFTDLSHAAGVDNAFWGWGTTFFDANNDGWQDLAATNGFFTDTDPSRLFLNAGGTSISFTDSADASGFNDTDWGSGLVAFDADRDGDLDLMQTCMEGPLRLMLNQSDDGHHWLTIRPRLLNGARPLDTKVRLTSGSMTQSRVISAGTSFMSQEPAEAHFGLGDTSTIDVLQIDWPDGTATRYRGISVDQAMTLTPPVFTDTFD